MDCPMATSQDFVNWVPTDCVTSDWLRVVFTADRQALLRFGKGTVHKTIYFPEWMSMHIALPPIEEQRKIAAIVDRHLASIGAAREILDKQVRQAKTLRMSILKAAFEGRLVPQDPNDEPASALLERIQAQAPVGPATKTKPTKGRKAATK
jgi:type I restriction enzyme S subunit